MTELGKTALEVANECFMDENRLTLHQITEFARLSEEQEPVAWWDEESQLAVNEKCFDTDVPLYLHPPLRQPDAEVLEAMKQAVDALDAGVKISPNSVLHDKLRAAINKLEKANGQG